MEPIIRSPEVSFEAFNFKVSNIERMEISNAISESRDGGKLLSDRLSAIVKKHHNLSVRFVLNNSLQPNAYVVPPKIDKNSPLVNFWRRAYGSNADGHTAINYSKGEAIGGVNFETGKVSGLFTQVTSSIIITRGALFGAGNVNLTDDELTAMIAHELGHILTYFATLGQSFRTAFILDNFVRAAMGNVEPEYRVKLIREFEEGTGVSITDKVAVEESDNPNVIATLVLSDIVNESRSQYGTTLYDMRSWEALSDQFAARLGCAADLATAMDKLYRVYEPIHYRGTFKYLMMEVGKTILLGSIMVTTSVPGLIFGGLVATMLFVSASPHQREYDKPYERVLKLRNELIAQLKAKDVPDEKVPGLLKDIEVINSILAETNDRQTFLEKLWVVVSPNTRRQLKMSKEIQELEQMVNNELFVSAAKLKELVK